MRKFTTSLLLAASILGPALLDARPAVAATITIINADGAGEGFNDPTVVSPVGGNPGTTRGAQRLNVFTRAASIWGALLPSSVEITVTAQFDPQFCTSNSAVLGSAGPVTADSDFPGAEFPNTWYPQALANKLAGEDRDPASDISATFNSDVDNGTCLGSVNWYYGYDGNEGGHVELLPVILHELGHGLGFATFANPNSGQLLLNTPDIYTRYMFDKTLGLHWSEMTDGQRLLSRTNAGNLVWDGPATTFRAKSFLNPRTEVEVYAPAFWAGIYETPAALFGPALTTTGVTAEVVEVNDGSWPPDACQPILNGAALNGKIAYIDRGTCSYDFKVAAAQAAGAVGVIVVNNVAGGAFEMPGNNPAITIPSVMISGEEGEPLREDVEAGGTIVTLRSNATVRSGMHPDGQVRLYAPNVLEPGSSLSHFDVSATPDLLMEPAINDGLHDGVDLTREAFEDIGWLPRLTAVPEGSAAPPFRVRSAPNPFHPSTVLSLELPSGGATRVEIYDPQGRLVKRLVNGWLPAGHHSVTWDGTNTSGGRTAAGVYFSRITANGVHAGQRLVKLD